MNKARVIAAPVLEEFSAAVFEKAGIPMEQARRAAGVLSWANLHGVDTHGIRNLKPMYIDPLATGKIRNNVELKITHETANSAVVDGDGGLGLVAADWAMRLAIKKAEQSGLCLISMRNSHHFGAAGYYSMQAAHHDMIGISMSGYFFAEGSEYGVLPTFGKEPMLSTNPMSVAFPTESNPPFLLDMATSIVPFNRVMLMKESNQAIPAGWGLDSNGKPTQDPAELRQLFPLGGSRELGGHKGFGLGLMVEIFCAMLSSGWTYTSEVSKAIEFNRYKQHNDAHFFGAIRLDLFRPANEFKKAMDSFVEAIHQAPTAPGHDQIYYPGEIEDLTRKERAIIGIPISDAVWFDLQSLAKKYGVLLENRRES
jgi:LDH2 family malate/lactate/ureidoglycolate dehydrogenase